VPLESQRAAKLSQPGAEVMEPLTRFWDRSGRIVLAVLGVLVAVGAVTYFTMRARAAAEETASGKLAEANIFFWQGDYPRALALAKQVAEQHGSTRSGHDAHRLAADAAFWGGDFKNAIAEYRRYLDSDKKGLLADAARRSLAYALESDKQYVEAANVYEQLIGKFDRTSSAEFLVAAARCYRAAGKNDEAIKRLERLSDEYGDTPYIKTAQIDLAELKALQAQRGR
jgi:tetratricopeptide (TPR) repeat protein